MLPLSFIITSCLPSTLSTASLINPTTTKKGKVIVVHGLKSTWELHGVPNRMLLVSRNFKANINSFSLGYGPTVRYGLTERTEIMIDSSINIMKTPSKYEISDLVFKNSSWMKWNIIKRKICLSIADGGSFSFWYSLPWSYQRNIGIIVGNEKAFYTQTFSIGRVLTGTWFNSFSSRIGFQIPLKNIYFNPEISLTYYRYTNRYNNGIIISRGYNLLPNFAFSMYRKQARKTKQ